MFSKKTVLLATCFSAIAVTACGNNYRKPIDIEDAYYWQRKNSSSALYLRGPKAQQLLHQDIASCTNEVTELERLGEIRRAIPANYYTGNTVEERTASQKTLDQWDSPEKDGYLYGEHLDYHDFEGCMVYKGWERVEYLPHGELERANKEYMDRYGKKRTRYGNRENVTTLDPAAQNPPPYENTNE